MPKNKKEETECPICEMFSIGKDSETARHLKKAKREIFLALKSLIEAGLKDLDREKKPVKKAKKVMVN